MTARAMVLGMVCLLVAGHAVRGDEVTAPVAGRIRLNGEPLASGRILFYLDDGEFVGSKVKDGEYKVSRVPAGVLRVGIEAEGMPAKYASEKSTLTVNVRTGQNTIDFDLKSR